jgi:hypothetical protein
MAYSTRFENSQGAGAVESDRLTAQSIATAQTVMDSTARACIPFSIPEDIVMTAFTFFLLPSSLNICYNNAVQQTEQQAMLLLRLLAP